jgi:hypothetical protein
LVGGPPPALDLEKRAIESNRERVDGQDEQRQFLPCAELLDPWAFALQQICNRRLPALPTSSQTILGGNPST